MIVDGKGVVHVVYGTNAVYKGSSTPTIAYSHNISGQTNFTARLDLDPLIAVGVGDYYPTISLETSTGNLYFLWLRGNDSSSPKTVMGRKNVSGTWSDLAILPQTNSTKQYLTSVYSISSEFKICWQWTQNVTVPIEVLYDGALIPEFSDITLPIMGMLFALVISRSCRKARDENR